ncbi:Hypothetical predicted protein [Octopus vulgaris]|uniref:Uncharacterized protein n=1 Tax=Octopus vulgaris TaxID=6645 RepID=A0AA36B627_OCTVU|nr:Hypothetical predicted protein [Octopus vulgaris]
MSSLPQRLNTSRLVRHVFFITSLVIRDRKIEPNLFSSNGNASQSRSTGTTRTHNNLTKKFAWPRFGLTRREFEPALATS